MTAKALALNPTAADDVATETDKPFGVLRALPLALAISGTMWAIGIATAVATYYLG